MKRPESIILYLAPFILAAALTAQGCKPGGGKGSSESLPTRTLTTPTPPGLMQDPDTRIRYVLDNFWKELADTSRRYLCDSLHVAGVENTKVEEQVGLYSTLLMQCDPSLSKSAVRRAVDLFTKAQLADTSSNILAGMDKLLSRYLYDPNSPVRNEDAYGAYAQAMAECPLVPGAIRSSFLRDSQLCSLNATGTPAADFSFLCRDGKTRTLYGTKAPLTLLFFSNPGCNNCAEITALLSTDELTVSLQSDGTLQIVNVYIDEEIDKWWEFSSEYPKEWICGCDPDFTIRTDLLYNVRAIPSLYLLDENKNVLLKDATTDRLMERLYALASK